MSETLFIVAVFAIAVLAILGLWFKSNAQRTRLKRSQTSKANANHPPFVGGGAVITPDSNTGGGSASSGGGDAGGGV